MVVKKSFKEQHVESARKDLWKQKDKNQNSKKKSNMEISEILSQIIMYTYGAAVPYKVWKHVE